MEVEKPKYSKFGKTSCSVFECYQDLVHTVSTNVEEIIQILFSRYNFPIVSILIFQKINLYSNVLIILLFFRLLNVIFILPPKLEKKYLH